MNSDASQLIQVQTKLMDCWNQPNTNFGSGKDKRSSDSGLIELLFGSLEKASRYQWLNGGRTLVDKTWLRIFWDCQGYSKPAISFDEMASRLDNFIRTHIIPCWKALNEPLDQTRKNNVFPWIEALAKNTFGSEVNYPAACSLLFYLLPSLEITPLSNKAEPLNNLDDVVSDLLQTQTLVSSIELPHEIEQPIAKALQPFLKNWWNRRLAIQLRNR